MSFKTGDRVIIIKYDGDRPDLIGRTGVVDNVNPHYWGIRIDGYTSTIIFFHDEVILDKAFQFKHILEELYGKE